MIDYHCHLDLFPNPLKLFDEVKEKNIELLAVTTSPRAYLKTSQYFSGAKRIRVALGFHPELLETRLNEQELFFSTVKESRFIGEIGIDGSQRYKDSLDIQSRFFKEALLVSEKNNGRIISIHSRGASPNVLSVIEQTLVHNKPVLHWFTGTTKEVEWALELGCWFSVNPQMCKSKQGQDLLKHIPISRVLPETDGPFTTNGKKPFYPWDETVVSYFSKMKSVPASEINKKFEENLILLETQ